MPSSRVIINLVWQTKTKVVYMSLKKVYNYWFYFEFLLITLVSLRDNSITYEYIIIY